MLVEDVFFCSADSDVVVTFDFESLLLVFGLDRIGVLDTL
jgi:hypothetical protein